MTAKGNKISGLAIIALVVGISGVGLGVYSTFMLLTAEIPETPEEYPIYYCDTEAEINTALADIGTGAGVITITKSITLTEAISITAGGSYIIQGITPGIVVDCNGDRNAFTITSVSTCTIRDLTLDASDFMYDDIEVINAVDSSLYFENLRIIGGASGNGFGIYINRPQAWVTNCYIEGMTIGIYIDSSASMVHISDNTILNGEPNTSEGIHLNGYGILCENNLVQSCVTGILAYADNSTIANNNLQGNHHYGINCRSQNSTFSGNAIVGKPIVHVGDVYGILVGNGAGNNVFTGNLVNSVHIVSGSGSGFGFRIGVASAINTTVVGNAFHYNDVNYSDLGTDTFESGNNY